MLKLLYIEVWPVENRCCQRRSNFCSVQDKVDGRTKSARASACNNFWATARSSPGRGRGRAFAGLKVLRALSFRWWRLMTREEACRWTINSFHSLDENLDECNECDEWSHQSILKLNAELTSEANLNFAKWTLITYKCKLNRQFDKALLLLSFLIKFYTERYFTRCDAEICAL